MKTIPPDSKQGERGSILVITIMTMTIIAMVCATSLYIASQNASGGMQTASWQQSLTAAESGVDRAIRALNTSDWTGWKSVSTSTLPTVEPTATATPSATAAPSSSSYNYFPSASSTLTASSANSAEGATQTTYWVTVDTAGMTTAQDVNGKQWYRIRSVGKSWLPGAIRVSMNRLDNDLRNTIGLRFDRKSNAAIAAGQEGPTRSIEVIMSPVSAGGWARAVTMKSGIQMSGGGSIGSFNSNSITAPYQWMAAYEDHPGNAGVGVINNTTNSDLRATVVNGTLQYSGTAVKNTSGVTGTISTPFSATITSPVDPTASGWAATDALGQQYGSSPILPVFTTSGTPNYTTITSATPSITVSGTKTTPDFYKVSGDFTVSGGHSFVINSSGTNRYVVIWVTGKFTTSGTGYISQDANVNVTWIVDKDITVSGDSYQNNAGHAAALEFVGVGTANKFTDSGSATFCGTLYAPGYDCTISGSGDFTGAILGNTLTVSGGASIHYDDALSGTNTATVGNYAFASWFEDNSDFTRKDVGGNKLLY